MSFRSYVSKRKFSKSWKWGYYYFKRCDSRSKDSIRGQSRLTARSTGIPSVIGFHWTELIYYGLIGQGYGYNERVERRVSSNRDKQLIYRWKKAGRRGTQYLGNTILFSVRANKTVMARALWDKDTFVILKTTNILCRARRPRYFTERFDLTHKWLSVRPQCAYRASRIRYPGPLISIDETIYLCPRVLSIRAGHLSIGTSRMRGTPNHQGEPLPWGTRHFCI